MAEGEVCLSNRDRHAVAFITRFSRRLNTALPYRERQSMHDADTTINTITLHKSASLKVQSQQVTSALWEPFILDEKKLNVTPVHVLANTVLSHGPFGPFFASLGTKSFLC